MKTVQVTLASIINHLYSVVDYQWELTELGLADYGLFDSSDDYMDGGRISVRIFSENGERYEYKLVEFSGVVNLTELDSLAAVRANSIRREHSRMVLDSPDSA